MTRLHLSGSPLKPFNPILGETFQSKVLDFHFYLEQTSHHPPVTNFYVNKFYLFKRDLVKISNCMDIMNPKLQQVLIRLKLFTLETLSSNFLMGLSTLLSILLLSLKGQCLEIEYLNFGGNCKSLMKKMTYYVMYLVIPMTEIFLRNCFRIKIKKYCNFQIILSIKKIFL